MNRGKHNLIYDCYRCHILFGHFELGSYIPTIEEMCGIFQVAPQTVRNALLKLQKDGLVSVSPGRHTIVTYDAPQEEKLRYTQRYYLARRDAIRDVYGISSAVLMPLFHEGCQRLSEEACQRMLKSIRNRGTDFAALSIICCGNILHALNNPLANSLLGDMIGFFQFPYVPWFDEMQDPLYLENHQLLVSSCESLDREGIFKAFVYLQKMTQDTLQIFIRKADEVLETPTQIPFQWHLYRARSQQCYSLAAAIVHKIIDGEYPENTLIPSYESVVKETALSKNTARRAAAILQDLGGLRSINGVGNQICFSEPNWKELQKPVMEKNISMALQSLEILSLTAGEVIGHAFELITERQEEDVQAILRKNANAVHGLGLVVSLMEHLTTRTLPFASEVYDKLFEFLLLAYPLFIYHNGQQENISQYVIGLEQSLRTRDAEQFSAQLLELLDVPAWSSALCASLRHEGGS